MRIPSAEVLSQWPKPNYADPAVLGPAYLVVPILLLSATTAMLGIRIYTRCRITCGYGHDDTVAVIAYVFVTAFTIVSLVPLFRYQFNRHTWDIEPGCIEMGLKLGLVAQTTFAVATSLTKISMLLLVVRITSASSQNAARRLALVMIVPLALATACFICLNVNQCRPVSAFWTLSSQPQKCLSQNAIITAAGIVNMAYEVVIMCLFPLPFCNALARAATTSTTSARGTGAGIGTGTWSGTTLAGSTTTAVSTLTGERRRSLRSRGFLHPVVLALLFFSTLVVIAGAVRTYLIFAALTDPKGDSVWGWGKVLIPSYLELNLALITASLPGIRPFFVRFVRHRVRVHMGHPTWQRQEGRVDLGHLLSPMDKALPPQPLQIHVAASDAFSPNSNTVSPWSPVNTSSFDGPFELQVLPAIHNRSRWDE